jgi:serine protease AprX
MHVGDLDATVSVGANSWSTTVEVTVHDANHTPLDGATVVGSWTGVVLASDTCTTGELGGIGTCIFLAPSIGLKKKSVAFTVTSVTASGRTYQASANHDPDGSSNGTRITATRP